MQNKIGNIASTVCEREDFFRIKSYLNKKFQENGYGLVVTSHPINHIIMDIGENGEPITKFIWQIACIFPDYQGGWIVEPIAEWEDYIESITIYDSSYITMFDIEFVTVYKMLRPKFQVGDELREIGTNYECVTIAKIDNENNQYLIHSPEAEEQIFGQWIIKFEDQYLYEKI